MNLDRIPASIPLTDALICTDCDTILEAPATTCPRCTNKQFISLAVWLDGRPTITEGRGERKFMSKRKKLSPYQRIIRAAKIGKGVLLNPDEVRNMAIDTAIRDLAENDDAD